MKKIFPILNCLIFLYSCGESTSEADKTDGLLPSEHRIFVTSQSFNGALGGISGANSKCSLAASTAGLTRKYKAVISDNTGEAKTNLQLTGAVYKFISSSVSVKLTELGSQLWDTDITVSNELFESIDTTETYQSLAGVTPWTGTGSGGIKMEDYCSNWTSSLGSEDGSVGDTESKDGRWVENNFLECNQSHPLYCISQ